jgi:hypothetical protein
VATLQREDFTLGLPAERVGDGRCDLKIGREMASNRLILPALEESFLGLPSFGL